MSDRPGHHDEDVTQAPAPASWVPGAVIAILIAVISLIMSGIALTKKPEHFIDPLKSTVDSLRTDNAQLHQELEYIKAHTDTTGVSDLREQVDGLTGMVEQRAADLDELQKNVNRYIINGQK
jgi:hypothetical protein